MRFSGNKQTTTAITLILLYLGAVWSLGYPVCNNDVSVPRVNCGDVGTTQAECQAANCCWSPVNPNPSNLPWCFESNTPVNEELCYPNNLRMDCSKGESVNQASCEAKTCCWDPIQPNPQNLPWCFYENPPIEGYALSNLKPTSYGLSGVLNVITNSTTTAFGPDIAVLSLDVYFETQQRVRIRITDAFNNRYEVPQFAVPRQTVSTAAATQDYVVSVQNSPFGIAVVRKYDNVVLFNSSIYLETFNGLIFKDQYIEWTTQLPAGGAYYGIGEITKSDGFVLDQNEHMYTLWNRDTPSSAVNQNLYGSHPFYLGMVNGNAHGVFMLNSNGMDIIFSQTYMTYRMIGGIIDLYVYTGPTPISVVQQHSQLVGLPYLPPYWSFGFHQSKYGYPNVWYLEAVVANYSTSGIPLDVMWSDIDYMDEKRDFTLDPVNYPLPEMQKFVATLHDSDQRYVVIEDPGIEVLPGYAPYDQLLSSALYIRDANGNPFTGCVWPGSTIFPDFLNPAAQPYWQTQIQSFYQQVPVDGLWIDMNEISNAFCDGECTASQCFPPTNNIVVESPAADFHFGLPEYRRRAHQAGAAATNVENPPYAINNGGDTEPLYIKTLNMNATHYNNSLEYNVHNLFGLLEAKATHQSLLNVITNSNGQPLRPFILSRSTWAGSGHWTAHWSGDNYSDWPNLWYSILALLNFNLYGVPMIGSDICGFNGNTTMELCARWIEVGAFYPFCRDHSSINTIPQELYRWPEVAAIGASILPIRYSLIPLYYTLMYEASQYGTPVIRPLFFTFTTDTKALGIDQQFMVGSTLLITPVINQGATTVTGYFPAGNWYSLYDYTPIFNSVGRTITLSAPLNVIQAHIRGGSILVTQSPAMTLMATRNNPYTVKIVFDADGQASGELYIDDGSTIDSLTNDWTYISYTAQAGTAKAVATGTGFVTASAQSLNSIVLVGLASTPSTFIFNGATVPSSQITIVQTPTQIVTVSVVSQMNQAWVLTWQ